MQRWEVGGKIYSKQQLGIRAYTKLVVIILVRAADFATSYIWLWTVQCSHITKCVTTLGILLVDTHTIALVTSKKQKKSNKNTYVRYFRGTDCVTGHRLVFEKIKGYRCVSTRTARQFEMQRFDFR